MRGRGHGGMGVADDGDVVDRVDVRAAVRVVEHVPGGRGRTPAGRRSRAAGATRRTARAARAARGHRPGRGPRTSMPTSAEGSGHRPSQAARSRGRPRPGRSGAAASWTWTCGAARRRAPRGRPRRRPAPRRPRPREGATPGQPHEGRLGLQRQHDRPLAGLGDLRGERRADRRARGHVDVGAEVQRRGRREAGRPRRDPHLAPAAHGHDAGQAAAPPARSRIRRRAASGAAASTTATAPAARSRSPSPSPAGHGAWPQTARAAAVATAGWTASAPRTIAQSSSVVLAMCGLLGREPRLVRAGERAHRGAREHERPERVRLGLGERQLAVEAGEHVERDPQRRVARVVGDRGDRGARRVADPPRAHDVAEVDQAVRHGRAARRADRVVVGDVAVDRLDGQRVAAGEHGGERRHRPLHQRRVRRAARRRRSPRRPPPPGADPTAAGGRAPDARSRRGRGRCAPRARRARARSRAARWRPSHSGRPVDPGHQPDVVAVGADDLAPVARRHRDGQREPGRRSREVVHRRVLALELRAAPVRVGDLEHEPAAVGRR